MRVRDAALDPALDPARLYSSSEQRRAAAASNSVSEWLRVSVRVVGLGERVNEFRESLRQSSRSSCDLLFLSEPLNADVMGFDVSCSAFLRSLKDPVDTVIRLQGFAAVYFLDTFRHSPTATETTCFHYGTGIHSMAQEYIACALAWH